MSSFLLCLICCFVAVVLEANAFASFMTSDFCSRALTAGEVIMNNIVIDSTDRVIVVKKVLQGGEVIVNSGDSVSPRDRIRVYISDLPSGEEAEHVFEVTGEGANFKKGGCGGKRAINNGAELDLSKATGSFQIVGGWARGHEEVQLTAPFKFDVSPKIVGRVSPVRAVKKMPEPEAVAAPDETASQLQEKKMNQEDIDKEMENMRDNLEVFNARRGYQRAKPSVQQKKPEPKKKPEHAWLGRSDVHDDQIRIALRGGDLNTQLIPSTTTRLVVIVFYILAAIVIYILYKLFPSNRFRVQRLVSKFQGQDHSK